MLYRRLPKLDNSVNCLSPQTKSPYTLSQVREKVGETLIFGLGLTCSIEA
jgi:hypothetical protein